MLAPHDNPIVEQGVQKLNDRLDGSLFPDGPRRGVIGEVAVGQVIDRHRQLDAVVVNRHAADPWVRIGEHRARLGRLAGHQPPIGVELDEHVAPHLSAAAAAAVLHGLALDSEARTPSTTAFAEEFRGTPIALARFDARTEARRSLSRSLIIVALAVALAAAGWLLFPR